MRVALHDVSKGRRGQELPPTALEFTTGEARFVLAETEQRPTVLGLIASGRMRPDSGSVTIDGATNPGDLRRRVALVDAQDVSDPPPNVTLAGVVSEELMFAGVPATPLHARRWLSHAGYADLSGVVMGNIDPVVRVRILCELAVLRKGVEGIVLVRPDRHGGRPDGWWRIAVEFAERGFAILVIVGGSAAAAIERMPNLAASGPVISSSYDSTILIEDYIDLDVLAADVEAFELTAGAWEPEPEPEPEATMPDEPEDSAEHPDSSTEITAHTPTADTPDEEHPTDPAEEGDAR